MPGQTMWPLHPPTTPVLRPSQPSSASYHQQRPEQPPRGRAMEHVRSDFERDGWSPERSAWKLSSNATKAPQTTSPALDMSFLDCFPKGEVTISYPNADGAIQRIHGINRGILEDRSALLSSALDGNGLHLEAVSHLTIKPFLQFMYTGCYTLPTPAGRPFEDVPTSLLVHCHMHRLGDIYMMPDLKTQAYANIVRQCEYGCSSPDAPIHLCQAIEYVYTNMREHADVIETIIAYCVTCFSRHRLGTSFDFRRIAYDLRPFHQDLCKVSMERRFEDNDTAQAIIQMPFKPYAPAAYASRNDERARQVFDDVYHFHGDDGFANTHKRRPSDKVPGENGGVPVLPNEGIENGRSIAGSSSEPQDLVQSSPTAGPSRAGMQKLTLLQRRGASEPYPPIFPVNAQDRVRAQQLLDLGLPQPDIPQSDSCSYLDYLEQMKWKESRAQRASSHALPVANQVIVGTGPVLDTTMPRQVPVEQGKKASESQEEVKEEDAEDRDEYKFVSSPVKTLAFETESDHDFVKVDLTPTKMAMDAEKLRPGSPYFNITSPGDWPDAGSSEDSEWDLV
ncbi:hypothetical protein CB0940_06640 [Cercospora beticola]|uniref:BTB domain-containing protein n=2 Tax=Cercospora beticola TaxID=122368 RepID=A0A2G5I0Z7_CERBT|nr:hypothetical protein CB0940_06640 [Cercospora beticola]PIA98421.1 hypothetical protein CB0940_06640 [Cercospora beticola]